MLKPVPDAIYLSLHSAKIVKTGLREIEANSIEEQKKYIEEKPRILIDTSFLSPSSRHGCREGAPTR